MSAMQGFMDLESDYNNISDRGQKYPCHLSIVHKIYHLSQGLIWIYILSVRFSVVVQR